MTSLLKNLVVIELVFPILMGALNAINRRANFAYFVTSAVTSITFLISLYICVQVFAVGDIAYHFGGWIPPVGIEFKITKLNSVFVSLVSFVATATFLHGKRILNDEIDQSNIATFCGVFLICFAGFIGVLLTNDFFNLYVFIEASSLSSYALIAVSKNRASLKAAFEYLIIGTIGATLILIGVGYLYVASGTLNMSDFIKILPSIQNAGAVKLGYCLILCGILVKSALFPLHTWFVKAYSSTSSFILPFLNGTSSKIYIFLALKLSYLIFGTGYSFGKIDIGFILGTMGAIAIIIGSVSALFQDNLRNMLIFSSIAQIGYTFVAISLGSMESAISATMFLMSNILAKTALFMLAAHIYTYCRSYNVAKMFHVKQYMPVVVTLFILNAASIIGLPLTIGFSAKIVLITELVKHHKLLIAAIIVIFSFVSILYMWKFVEAFLYNKAGTIKDSKVLRGSDVVLENKSYKQLAVVTAMTALNIVCGIYFRSFYDFVFNLM